MVSSCHYGIESLMHMQLVHVSMLEEEQAICTLSILVFYFRMEIPF